MNSKNSNRVGFNINVGSLNPRLTFSETQPSSPDNYEMWVDTSGADWKLYVYSGTAWKQIKT